MAFHLDTSGEIVLPFPHLHPEPRGYVWADLSPFAQGYVEAMFTGLDHPGYIDVEPGNDDAGHVPVGFRHLAPETLARIMEDCAEFLAVFGLCDVATPQECGRIFWEQRKDPEWCSSRVENFPPLTPYLHDDGKIHLR